MPGLKLTHHECTRQQVEVATHRWLGYTQRASQLGAIPNLCMIVSQHVPEAQQHLRSDADPSLREIALQKGLNKISAPCGTVCVRRRQKRQREAAPQPVHGLRLDANLGQTEPAHAHRFNAARQRFGGLTQQVGRGAAEDQETGRQRRAVAEHAQRRKEIRPALNLINDDQSAQILE